MSRSRSSRRGSRRSRSRTWSGKGSTTRARTAPKAEPEGWVQPATAIHVELLLAQGLREADVLECAAQGWEPDDALWESFTLSRPDVFTIMAEGVPVGMFGVACVAAAKLGAPWLLATNGIFAVARKFLCQTNAWVDHMNEIYPTLTNWVDTRNEASVRWLAKAGFTFHETTPAADTVLQRFERCALSLSPPSGRPLESAEPAPEQPAEPPQPA